MMMRNDFAVFILSHGRADRVYTYKTLKQYGYTGNIHVVIDDEDETADEYYRLYGDKVVMFQKAEIAKTFDEGDNFGGRRGVVYARNANFEIAKKLGYKYFLQLDDDYLGFYYKFNKKLEYDNVRIGNLDKVFELMIRYLEITPFYSIAFAQQGDFIGGRESGMGKSLGTKRKCMNSFFCKTDRPFQFVGRINEDVNTYTVLQRSGKAFLTITAVSLQQVITQQNRGGMTELYLDKGTFVKSFYTVMYTPSCTTVSEMGAVYKRLHHRVCSNAAFPKIIQERYKKR